MALISWSTTSLISGVSQQPDTLRFASQAEIQENGFSSIVDGLTKRHPTEHVARVVIQSTIVNHEVSFHTINRDISERYLVLFFGGDAIGGSPPNAPGVWVWDIENNVRRTIEGPGGQGDPSDLVPANWDYLNNTHPSKLRAMSVADNTFVVNPTVKVEEDAAVLDDMSTDAFIFVRSSNYKSKYTATVDTWKAGGGHVFHDATVNTWDGNDSTSVVNKDVISITAPTTAGSKVWTAYFLGDTITHTQAGGGTNPGASNGVAASLATLIAAKNGLTATASTNNVTVSGTCGGLDTRGSIAAAPAGGSWTITETQAPSTSQDEMVNTDDIAAELSAKLTAFAGTWATFSVVGSVIRCIPKYGADGTTDNPEFKGVQLQDSNANSLMELTHKKVDTVTNLPLTCLDGFKIEVQGDAEAAEDNFYLEFEAKDGADVFGAGIWKETSLGGEKYKLKKTTMPHRLERFFTPAGVPFFIWDAVDWGERVVGDIETTNSFPSFTSTATADNYISDVFFFRSRMGFLSNDNVILSEIGTFENFFRTATTAVLDGDPIDVGVGHSSVAVLHSAVSWNEKLVIFSDQTQFVLSGEPYLTPQTVQVSAVTDFENYTSIRPLTSGQGIAFGYAHGDFSGIRELNQVNENVYSADDLTQAIPKYIDGTITTFAPTTLENMLAVLADGDTSSLYIYKYYFGEGQRLQASWSKYTLGSGADIQHVAFIENTLYIAVRRAEGLFIEKMVISDGQADADSTYITTLDRRVADTDCTSVYTAATDTTAIVLPYEVASAATYQVVSRATSTAKAGHIYTLSGTPSGTTITVVGDVETDSPFWVGEKYNFLYQFSAPRLREATSTRGGRGIVATGRQQIKYGTLVYDESSYFKITVTPEGRDGQVNEFSSIVLDSSSSLIGEVNLDSGGFRFPIHSKNDQVTITLENDSPLPSNFVSIEWEADFTSQSKRYRG